MVFYLYDIPTRGFRWALGLSIPGIYLLYSLGDISALVSDSWRVGASPLVYVCVCMYVERALYLRTRDPGFSLLVAVASVVFIGYFHEIPRYWTTGSGLIRYNINSIFYAEPGIVGLSLMASLYLIRGWVPKRSHLGALGLYIFYSWLYMGHFDLLNLGGELIPWIPGIVFIRWPSIVLVASLPLGLNK